MIYLSDVKTFSTLAANPMWIMYPLRFGGVYDQHGVGGVGFDKIPP